MRIKIDEDLPASLAVLLCEAEHDACTVAEQGLTGWSDESLFSILQEERRLLITADKGFGDLRHHPPGTHRGVVVLRADRESIGAYRALLRRLLKVWPLESLVGCVTVVSPRAIRIRRPPDGP